MNDRTTNRNQWIAILILGAMVLCALGVIFTGPIQSPVSTRPLWNVPTTATVRDGPAVNSNPVCYFGDSTAVNGQIQSFNGENKVCVVDSYGNASWTPLEEYLTTTYGTPVPTEVAYTPITPAAATNTPIVNIIGDACYFSAVRMTDGHVPGGDRLGVAGRCQIDPLTGQVSLQAYWEETVTNDTVLPVGLKKDDVVIGVYEPFNDAVLDIAIGHDGILYHFVADTIESETTLPFWKNSCVVYDRAKNIVTFYEHDNSNGPGGFNGTCAGTSKSYVGKAASVISGYPAQYVDIIENLAANGYIKPSTIFTIDIAWFEAWPQ